MAIIYTIEIQDGERQYTEWNFDRERNYSDYESDELTDRELLEDFYGTELEDLDRVTYRGENNKSNFTNEYWVGEMIVYIGKVNSITEEHLEIVRRYV